MKRVLLALALTIGGCKASNRTNVFITESGIEYKVRVEFVLPIKYESQYPFISRAFKDAVNSWAEAIPIDPVIIPYRIAGYRQIDVYIRSGDFMGSAFGRYVPSARILFLNSTWLTTYSDAYDVALHEIGHIFGLQHVGEENDVGRAIITGMIIVLNTDVEHQLMYPYLSDENRGVGISSLDIELARLYLRRELSW